MNDLIELARQGKINENASIKDGHSAIINQPVDQVWSILTNIQQWPEWNPTVKSVSIDGSVEVGRQFKWNLNGTKILAQIQYLEPSNTISCTGKSKWVKSIFVWKLESDDNQTIVTLNASIQGAFTLFFKNHQKVYNDLIGWLANLKRKAEGI